MRILSVDDSLTARLIIKRALEPEGHTVLEAPDGAVALSVLEAQGPFDLVILDWNMPVMNGLDCLKEIRRGRTAAQVKVIMCTTEGEKGRVMEAIKAGANGYVLKPVDVAGLKAQVEKVVGIPA